MMVTDITDVPAHEFRDTIESLRDDGYRYLDWLSAVDQTDAAEAAGFDLVCHLIDVDQAEGLRSVLVRTRLLEGAAAPSLTGLYRGAAWHERETHEMFGIDFDGFDDGSSLGMRPLLLPDGFDGTPLRKSFMLAARASKAWPGAKEPGEGRREGYATKSPGRRRVQAPGVPPPQWGPR